MNELGPWLTGSFFQKLWQLGPDDFLLHFYRPRGREDEIPSCHPLASHKELRLRLVLTPGQVQFYPWLQEKPEAAVPSAFCMQLRKHCQGRKVQEVLGWKSFGLQRQLAFHLDGPMWTTLVCECWDRHPNLILLKRPSAPGTGAEEPAEDKPKKAKKKPSEDGPISPWGTILGAHRFGRFGGDEGGGAREVRPGRGYQPTAISIFDPSRHQLFCKEGLFGVSERLQLAIGLQRGKEPADAAAVKKNWEAIWTQFLRKSARAEIDPRNLVQWTGCDQGAFEHVFGALCRSTGADSRVVTAGLDQPKRQLLRRWKMLHSKQERLVAAIEGDIKKAEKGRELQQQADLLYSLPPELAEQPSVVLTAWDGVTQYTFERPRHGRYSELAGQLSKKAKKLRTSLRFLEPRQLEEAERLQRLAELETSVLMSNSPAELDGVAAQLSSWAKGSNEVTPSSKRKQRQAKPLLQLIQYRFTSPQGTWILWVGRNSSQNEYLLQRIAKRDDLWFHVKDGSGSYVILKQNGVTPPGELVFCAGHIAARHSSRKTDSKVLVVSTACSNLRRPAGTPRGTVTYREEMTLPVDPQLELEVLLERDQSLVRVRNREKN